ncbi:MAG: hypothetical protein J5965_05175 [Aeriscardovia sp.]|nr:hypothetical protein [Aeriscardovia sp.]
MNGSAKRSADSSVDRTKYVVELKKNELNVSVEKLKERLKKRNTKNKSVARKRYKNISRKSKRKKIKKNTKIG